MRDCFRMSHEAARYSWGAEFPEQHSPFVLGTDLLLDVAVQVEARAVPEYLDRFRLAHGRSTQLNHPNILQDFQLIEEPDRVLLFSQQFPGQTLSEILTDEPLTTARCLEVLIPVAQAVNYACGYSSVHRLISPQTIWLHNGQVKLRGAGWEFVDFYAQHTSESRSRWSEPLAYFSPELVLGERVTNQSDQFSLGVLLYRLASGRLPFPSQSVRGVVDQILADSPDLECLPPRLQPIVERCLRKEADKRFPTMQALLAEFGVEPDCQSEREGYLISAALARLSAGEPEEALEVLREALTAYPYSALVHGHIGLRLNQINRHDEATDYFQRAIELKPFDPTFRYVFGHCELTRGNLERAALHFRRVLAISPDYASAQEGLSSCQ